MVQIGRLEFRFRYYYQQCKHQIRLFYDGDGPGKGGEVTIYVDGESVARERVENTQVNIFSADKEETRLTGKIDKVIVAEPG